MWLNHELEPAQMREQQAASSRRAHLALAHARGPRLERDLTVSTTVSTKSAARHVARQFVDHAVKRLGEARGTSTFGASSQTAPMMASTPSAGPCPRSGAWKSSPVRSNGRFPDACRCSPVGGCRRPRRWRSPHHRADVGDQARIGADAVHARARQCCHRIEGRWLPTSFIQTSSRMRSDTRGSSPERRKASASAFRRRDRLPSGSPMTNVFARSRSPRPAR